MKFSDLEQIRVDKIKNIVASGINPYPTSANPTHTTISAREEFDTEEKKEDASAVKVCLAGRLRSLRVMGKIIFSHLEDSHGRLQLFFRVNELGKDFVANFRDIYDIGDYVEASGVMMRTKTGEATLHVHEFRMLAKAITPLPAAKDEVVDGETIRHASLSDPEMRFRQRYADLIVNPEVREVFRKRAKTVKALRNFLDDNAFLEVETPILQPIYGGAAAQPFVTHHNQLKQDLYLRISFELYLKRLIVGMMDRVYEIGRDFRNEGVSYKHNPEFTQLEFYMAYADYLQVMEFTENMLAYVCDEVLGSRKFMFNGNEISMELPWKRVELRQGLIDTVGIDIEAFPTKETLYAAMQEKGISVAPTLPRGKLIDSLIGDYLEPSFIQPTFLYNYPREISPLAKSKAENPQIVERFEGFVGGMELCNAFSELNDPQDQEARFLEMGRDYEDGDDEQHPMDDDYLQALSYGMPPTGGFGMGIDRLVMLLADQPTIREVILFPHLRERTNT
ncbi:MAG: lysine--tRNA ligase [Anaerolineaceae bacterium]|nr:lysine--tRNA ligase [Anaerolineaceae bacterium]